MDEIFPLRHIDCYMIEVTIEMLNTNLKLLTIFGDSFECKLTFKINKKTFLFKNNLYNFRCGKTGYKNLSKKYQGQKTKDIKKKDRQLLAQITTL